MSINPKPQPDTADREIVVSRLIDAPRELVFSAWADTEQVGKWWGPNGFTTTTKSRDFRSGGSWDFVMHGPDGRDYINKVYYREIIPPQYIAHLHSGDDGVVQFHAHTTFEEVDGKTLVSMRLVFPSREVRDTVVKERNAIEGGNQTLARFAEYVAGLSR